MRVGRRKQTKRAMKTLGVYSQAKSAYLSWRHAKTSIARRFGPVEVTIADVTVHFPVPTQRIYSWVTDMPERDLIAWFCYELKHDDVVWDVGAHIGMFAFPAAGRVPDGRVVAFEPGPDNLAYLRRVAALNGTDSLAIEPLALGSSDETLGLATLLYAR